MRLRTLVCSTALLLLGVLTASPAHAQRGADDLGDLSEALSSVSAGYADNYVQPVSNAFGANINAGLFRSADVGDGLIPLLPFDVYLGVNVSGTLTSSVNKSFVPFAPDGQESFTSNGREFTVSYTGIGEVPTAFGETTPPAGDLVIRDEQTGVPVARGNAPQGLVDTPIAPLPIPQLGIGSVLGTDLQVRYFPKTSLSTGGSTYGQVGLLGLAVRHDIDQWFPTPLPFNLAVQGAWNQFSLENTMGESTSEVVDANSWAVNVHASRGIPVLPLLFYGGVQYERFNAEYQYTLDPPQSVGLPTAEISLDQTADNTVRGLVGFSLTFAVVRFNVDFAVGNQQNVLTTGLGVRL
jgi:hypothetical protein